MTLDDVTQLLADLSEPIGVSGREAAVHAAMRRHLAPLGAIVADRLGGLAAHRVGRAGCPRVLLAAHLDEIGLMVTRITDEGLLKFQPIGGWWPPVLIAQRVRVQAGAQVITGVVGSRPPHLLSDEERGRGGSAKDLFIDIGASSRAEAEAWGVRPGDAAVLAGQVEPLHSPDLLLGRAWDNRVGCTIAIEVLRRLQCQDHPNELFAGATVQEEVGLRGAGSLAHVVRPDVAIVLEAGIAGDTPGVGPDDARARLGGGPVLLLHDGSMIAHRGLLDVVLGVAQAEGIAVQLDSLGQGGTDGGRLHVSGAGVPTLVLAVPLRYIHTPAALLDRRDVEAAVRLIVAVVRQLDDGRVRQITGGAPA